MKEYRVKGRDGRELTSYNLGTLVAMMEIESGNFRDQTVRIREPTYQTEYNLTSEEIQEVRQFLSSISQPVRLADQTRVLTPIEINHA